jgi:hypothetical protein
VRNQHEAAEKHIKRGFIFYTLRQIVLGSLVQEERRGGKKEGREVREIRATFN